MSWSYSYSPDVWPAAVTLALVIGLGWYSWRRRTIAGAKPFTVACLFGALWSLGAILEILAVFHILENKTVFQPVQVSRHPVLGKITFLFCLDNGFTGKNT